MYLSVVLFALAGLESVCWLPSAAPSTRALMRNIVLSVCVIWLLRFAISTGRSVASCVRNGPGGYSSPVWQDSPLMAWLRLHPLQGRIYSNDPEAVYILTGATAERTPNCYADVGDFARRISSSQGGYIVWTNIWPRDYLLDLRELISRYDLEESASFSDGAIYRIRSDAVSDAPLWAVYRFWSPRAGRHLYTIHKWERDALPGDSAFQWAGEGVSFYAYADQTAGTLPVYRLWSARLQTHFYTTSEAERNQFISSDAEDWASGDIAFYVYPEKSQEDLSPVYRLRSRDTGRYLYTASETEMSRLVEEHPQAWIDEGVAWYAYAP